MDFFTRCQSTSKDFKSAIYAELRKTQPLDTWNTPGLQGKRFFLVINFLGLIRPEIIIKEFTILRHQVLQDRFQCITKRNKRFLKSFGTKKKKRSMLIAGQMGCAVELERRCPDISREINAEQKENSDRR